MLVTAKHIKDGGFDSIKWQTLIMYRYLGCPKLVCELPPATTFGGDPLVPWNHCIQMWPYTHMIRTQTKDRPPYSAIGEQAPDLDGFFRNPPWLSLNFEPPSFMRFAVVAGHKGRGRDLQIIIIIFVTARPRCSLAVRLSRCLDTDWINNFNFPFIRVGVRVGASMSHTGEQASILYVTEATFIVA